jgi:hypothetical protein
MDAPGASAVTQSAEVTRSEERSQRCFPPGAPPRRPCPPCPDLSPRSRLKKMEHWTAGLRGDASERLSGAVISCPRMRPQPTFAVRAYGPRVTKAQLVSEAQTPARDREVFRQKPASTAAAQGPAKDPVDGIAAPHAMTRTYAGVAERHLGCYSHVPRAGPWRVRAAVR